MRIHKAGNIFFLQPRLIITPHTVVKLEAKLGKNYGCRGGRLGHQNITFLWLLSLN